MNKIEKLIDKLCPNGVEFKRLGEICQSQNKATLKVSELDKNGLYPVINSGRDFYGYYNDFNNEGETITFASRGEYAGYIKYFQGRFFAGGLCYPYKVSLENKLLTKFLYFYLKSKEKDIMENLVSRGSIPALNKADIEDFRIPIPPLEIQEEVVKIFDNFSDLTADLTAELTARKKQYKYYRNTLLDFGDENNPKDGVEFRPISSFAKCMAGATPKTSNKEYWEQGTIPWMSSGEVNNKIITTTEKKITKLGYESSSTKLLPKNTVVIALAGQGKTRGLVGITKIELCTNQSLCGIIADNSKVLSKFLYYYLQKCYLDLRHISSGDGNRGGLNLSHINNYIVPIPPLETQQRIVDILDRFEALTSDYQEGLPAEIEARTKQYEYYRDKLLDFKELESKNV